MRQAVLSGAPRIWLFNARIQRALKKMRLRERQDADAAAKRLASIARLKIEAYDRSRRSASEEKLRIKDLAALSALGVREHLIGGTGCFTVRSETWPDLDYFLRTPLPIKVGSFRSTSPRETSRP
ncbi:hypothetical protein [Mesorhizobium sp. M1163]|uniref:hypothetical protein n=1 Tax=Mesorhizobium sp. M1163 TaxID=2957065 RepID=UPI00333BD2DA